MNTAYRYFRPSVAVPFKQDQMKVFNGNMGGITAYIEFSDDMKTLKVSFAVCRSDENFDKSIGREQAQNNMSTGDYIVMPAIQNDGIKRRLVDHVFGYFKNHYYEITTPKQRANTIGTVRKMMDEYINNVNCDKFEAHSLIVKSFLTPMLDPNYIPMVEKELCGNCETCDCEA